MCIGYLPPLILQMFFAAGGIFPTVIARLLIKYRRNPEGPKAKRNTPCPLHLVLIYLVTLFDPKFQIFKSSQSWRFLAFLTWPLNIVNVARFARNVEWDFFYVIFKHCEMMSFQELNPSVSLHFMLYLLYLDGTKLARHALQRMKCNASFTFVSDALSSVSKTPCIVLLFFYQS